MKGIEPGGLEPVKHMELTQPIEKNTYLVPMKPKEPMDFIRTKNNT